ncbi:MAG: trehalose-phosphatase [Candidatus Methylomirabilales bacterium]
MDAGSPKLIINLDTLDAAIFDLDGVVTKTARVHAAAWKKLFDEYLEHRAADEGKPFQPFDVDTDYRRYVDGKPRYDGVRSFLQSRGITLPYGDSADGPDRETICGLGNRKDSLFHRALREQGVATYPSTITFIHALRSRGLKTAIVSSSKNCGPVLDAAGLSALFDAKVDGLDIARQHLQGKPAPDMFLKAATLLGVPPARAVVFEDALAGVQAGRAGHFGLVVGVDRAGQAAALQKHGADIVVPDIGELAIGQGEDVFTRPIQELPSALDSIQEIIRGARGRHLALFLDYDGTLTPIVDRPELATMSQEMRDTVKALADRCTVAIVSGRDRGDVEQLVQLDALYYAGSHGFDIAGPRGWQERHEPAARYIPAIDRAEKTLRQALNRVKGTIIERKKYSVAVHHRLVAAADMKAVQEAVKAVLSQEPELRRMDGKKVYELQPRIDWDKGKAVLWLLQALGLDTTAVLPLYVGDDLTDEDAFRALKDIGIGVVVGEDSRRTIARYALRNPDEVAECLRRLTSLAQSDVP